MRDLYAWAAIGLIILASTTGDVLLSHAMKRVGDVGNSGSAADCSPLLAAS